MSFAEEEARRLAGLPSAHVAEPAEPDDEDDGPSSAELFDEARALLFEAVDHRTWSEALRLLANLIQIDTLEKGR